MAGIYIHIPFCRQACHYCDFHFSTSLKNKLPLLHSVKKEIELQKDYLEGEVISTIYFGGGTPSLLSVSEINEILNHISKFHQIDPSPEITLEANPDDLSSQKLKELKQTPVNRLSIGIQSFFDADLKFMNRAHNAAQAIQSIKDSQNTGFENISIDLIYGTPTLNDQQWEQNIETVTALNIPHISSYCLTVEPKTALSAFIKKGEAKDVDEEQASGQFQILMRKMQEAGYLHYEISNFCKPGHYSKHNSNYWLKEKYLGIGPSAHSFNGHSRQWNISNNSLYIRSLDQELIPCELETLSTPVQFNEYILTSLRTIWGCDMEYINTNFGGAYSEHLAFEAKPYLLNGWLSKEENKLTLSPEGKLMADKIASDLFVIE